MSWIILTNDEGASGLPISVHALKDGKSTLDAIEAGIRFVELDPKVRCVGFGGAPNMLGEMELDASIMNGDTLETGAVGAVKGGVAHPISLARQVMEKLPHVMLVGEGATRFAKECGLEFQNILSEEARLNYQKWNSSKIGALNVDQLSKMTLIDFSWPTKETASCKGTVITLIRDEMGRMAGGVSTSGWDYKYPGRLGDSPIIGAGLYVDSKYGGCACTHTGEMSIRCGTSRSVVLYMKKGATVEEACLEAKEDLGKLKVGFLGAVIIHAMDKEGEHFVTSFGEVGSASYYYWSDEKDQLIKEVVPK
ncbi:MAG: N(4)-(beta-N-acetylglucosaminyl)-L-asparaginase [bacterium]|nr:N(4)-(beta-N-acetylglucosaminyl)-L-asparaginase [bacterium]